MKRQYLFTPNIVGIDISEATAHYAGGSMTNVI